MTAVSVPTIELEDPAGRRVVVAPRSADDRIGELADALGIDPHQDLRLDGRPVGRHDTLAGAGVVRGSRLEPATREGADATQPAAGPTIAVVVEAGPAAGATLAVGPGSHVVGRAASAAIVIDDPALEPHHALLDVSADGAVGFVQLTGRVPARLAGEPVYGPTAVAAGAVVEIGASRLRIGTAPDRLIAPPVPAPLTPTRGDPWRRTVRRQPRARPRWDPDPIGVPDAATAAPGPSATGFVAAAVTMAGSFVVAIVMQSPMFVLLGAVGGLASLGLWLAGRLRARRDGRRAGRTRERDLEAFATAIAAQRDSRWRHHLAVTPTVTDAVAEASVLRPEVWSRRGDHPDAFAVTLGWGPVRWEPVLDYGDAGPAPIGLDLAAVVDAAGQFTDAPVPTDLGPGTALALTGPSAAAVARALIVQLATWTGPADWRLVVVADDPERWDWCRWLPHSLGGNGAAMVVAADDAALAQLGAAGFDPPRHVLLVTDRPDLLALRTGAVRRFVGASASAAVLVVVPAGEPVPAMCDRAMEIGSLGIGRWCPDTSAPARADRVRVAGITMASAAQVARRLAALHDPEDTSVSELGLASAVTLSSLSEEHGPGPIDDAIAVAGAWRSAGPDPPPAAAIGNTADGIVEIDLARDGPHALIAGTTGSGKSELLRTLVVALAAGSSPDHLTFVLVDYKGGATFDACADLPHTVGVVTDLDERLAERALLSLDAELRRRERLLRDAGAEDLAAYRARPGHAPLPRLVVVIDEFAALATEVPGFLASLVGVAQRGRSLGIHLVLATQRPSGIVDDDIRANTNLRLALRLQHPADARDVVGDSAPAAFPRGTPGRAMLRLGPDETVVFQAARSSGPVVPRREDRLRVVGELDHATSSESELAVLVRAIRHAAALSDIAPGHRPWLPPLPERIGATDGSVLGAGDAGIVDDPAAQRRLPLRWDPSDGHLALLGASGAGTTTALLTVLATLAAVRSPSQFHVYVVDAGGDRRLDDVTRLPHCGAVVRFHEAERLGRLLRRLTAELDTRRRDGGRGERPQVVLAIDGIAALRGTLAGAAGSVDVDALTRIVAEGAALGVACVLTAERPGVVPPSLLASCGERWLFRLDDPAEAVMAGVPAAAVPRCGPGRIVIASCGLEAQLAKIDVDIGCREASGGGPAPVGTLAPDVDAAGLPPGRLRPDGETELVVGIDFASLGPAVLTVPDGEHVLIAGPPRSGRTTALARLAASWRQAHPDGAVHIVAPGDRLAIGCPGADRPCLVVVDDAERIEDDDGALAALAAERRPGLLILAAGRPDALRTQYGQWTNVVRRSRLGLLMSMCADTEGDLLGELLPRHSPLPPRQGLAWLIGGGDRALVQVGRHPPNADVSTVFQSAGRRPVRQTDPAT